MPGYPKYGRELIDGNVAVADDNCCYCFGTGVSVFALVISSLI